jgi:hypothetical protein
MLLFLLSIVIFDRKFTRFTRFTRCFEKVFLFLIIFIFYFFLATLVRIEAGKWVVIEFTDFFAGGFAGKKRVKSG